MMDRRWLLLGRNGKYITPSVCPHFQALCHSNSSIVNDIRPAAFDLGTPLVPSYMDCMKLCASKPTCVSTAWINDVVGPGTCYMKSHGQHIVQTNGYALTSTHLVGPAWVRILLTSSTSGGSNYGCPLSHQFVFRLAVFACVPGLVNLCL
jgi:hypothetical protein